MQENCTSNPSPKERRKAKKASQSRAGAHGIWDNIGYLLRKEYWHQGYATEAAKGCVEYAFTTLFAPAVYALVREDNLPSQQVAKRLGMEEVGSFVRHYCGEDLPHLIFYLENEDSPVLDL